MRSPLCSFFPTSATSRRPFVFSRVLPNLIAVLLLAAFSLGATAEANAQTALTFDKSFSPSTIGPGSVSTLTFNITNNTSTATNDLAFTDNLPAGVTIATPANVISDCGVGVSAPDGGSTISLTTGSVGASASCSITVEVTSSTAGTHSNVSGTLTSSIGNGGTASADLTVATDRPGFSKSFSPSTVAFGNKSTLTFTINNTLNSGTAFALNFTDNLPSGMTVASPANASTTCTNGGSALTAVPGASVVGLQIVSSADPRVAAGASCTVSVDVVGGAVGQLDNVSGELTSTPSAGSARSSGKAAAALTVTSNTIILTKSFIGDPVVPGNTVTLDFTILNRSRGDQATNIAFSDNLENVLSGLEMASVLSNDCGGSATGTSTISFSGGSVSAGASCTLSVSVQVPSGATPGNYTNTTSVITADVGGQATTGAPAIDDLFVEPTPRLTKTFLTNPVGGGGTTTIRYTITNTSPDFEATDIAYNDSLLDIIPTSITVPADGSTCGTGSDFTFLNQVQVGTDNIPARFFLTGGRLDADASCTIDLEVDVAVGAPQGVFADPTSTISAMVDGITYVGNAASDNLLISGPPEITKVFTDDPVEPGDTVTLNFTLMHLEAAPADANGIAFTDNLDAVISGLELESVLSNDCGGTISGTSTISFSGGSLIPGASCTISTSLTVPSTATSGNYTNTTSGITATVGGVTTVGIPAEDDLIIATLRLTKVFNPNPVTNGTTTDYTFTLENLSATDDATGIAIREQDLEQALSGLRIVTPVDAGTCDGTLTTLSSNRILDYSGGSLTAGSSCSFTVTLDVPTVAAANVPQTVGSPTTTFAATIGGSQIGFNQVTATLTIEPEPIQITLSKSFSGTVEVGNTVDLDFMIDYEEGPSDATNIAFTDDLTAVLPGLAVSGSLPSSPCGGTLVDNSGVLELTGGTLSPTGTCSFSVTLLVPETTVPAVYVNVTSTLTATVNGNSVEFAGANANLTVEEGPVSGRNDPPVLANIEGAALAYTENDPATEITSTITVSDTDDTNLESATVQITGNYQNGEDVLGDNGSVPAGITVGAFNAGDGSIGLSGSASLADYQAALRAVTYANTSDDPNASTRTVSFTVNDGDDDSNTETRDITVAPVNDPPVVTASGGTTAFVEDVTGAVVIDAAVTVTDADDTDLEGATVSITTGFETSQDVLGFTDQNGITGVYNSGTGVLTLTGTSSVANYQTALQSVTYDNTSQDPTKAEPVALAAGPRTVEFQANDGDDDSNVSTQTVSVTATNDGPTADAGEDQTLECTSAAGADATLDGSGSSDPENMTLTFSWAEGGQEIATGESPTVTLALGVHTITLMVDDGAGGTDTDDVVITVQDTTAPVITLNGDNPLTIIRFSGPYVEPGATVADACDPTPTLTIAGTVDTNLPGAYPITYDASDASGNDAAQVVRTVNVIDDPNAVEHDFLFLVEKKMDIQHTVEAEGDLHSNDEIVIQHDGTIDGDLTAVGKITLQHDVTIDGDVIAGDALDLHSNVTITGTATEFASVDDVPLPSLSFSAGGNDITVDEDETLALAPGSYGKVEVKKRATLQLSTGDYFFVEMKTEDEANLEVDVSTGPVEVNVEKKIDIHKDLTTTLSPLGEVDSRYLTLSTMEDITVGERSVLLAQVIAPEGKMDMQKEALFRGSVCAEEITVHENAVVLHHDASGTLPEVIPEVTAPAVGSPTAEEEEAAVPEAFVLEQNYPNPFNPETRIRFGVPEATYVTLVVYDMLGRQVRVLVDGTRSAGTHEVVFEAGALPSGTYLYRLETPEGSIIKTLLLMK